MAQDVALPLIRNYAEQFLIDILSQCTFRTWVQRASLLTVSKIKMASRVSPCGTARSSRYVILQQLETSISCQERSLSQGSKCLLLKMFATNLFIFDTHFLSNPPDFGRGGYNGPNDDSEDESRQSWQWSCFLGYIRSCRLFELQRGVAKSLLFPPFQDLTGK